MCERLFIKGVSHYWKAWFDRSTRYEKLGGKGRSRIIPVTELWCVYCSPYDNISHQLAPVMSFLLVHLLSFPFVSAAIQVFVFPSGPSSNISSVLYTNVGINQRSNSNSLGGKLLPQELTICSSHQQELLDGSPPYQVLTHLIGTKLKQGNVQMINIAKLLVCDNPFWLI